MKKIIGFIISFLFIFSVAVVYSADLEITSAKGQVGEEVAFTVYLTGSPDSGMEALGFDIVYDAGVLEYLETVLDERGMLLEDYSFKGANDIAINDRLHRLRIGAFTVGPTIEEAGILAIVWFRVISYKNTPLLITHLVDDFQDLTDREGWFCCEKNNLGGNIR